VGDSLFPLSISSLPTGKALRPSSTTPLWLCAQTSWRPPRPPSSPAMWVFSTLWIAYTVVKTVSLFGKMLYLFTFLSWRCMFTLSAWQHHKASSQITTVCAVLLLTDGLCIVSGRLVTVTKLARRLPMEAHWPTVQTLLWLLQCPSWPARYGQHQTLGQGQMGCNLLSVSCDFLSPIEWLTEWLISGSICWGSSASII
jgi:hypothetical protein